MTEYVKKLILLEVKLNTEIISIQSSCEHNFVKRTHRADIGNYCNGDDIYWTDCVCLICYMQWKESQR